MVAAQSSGEHVTKCGLATAARSIEQQQWSKLTTVCPSTHTYTYILYIHTHIQTLDNKHNSQAQGLNWRHRWLLGGKRTVDISDEQTDRFFNET